MEAEEEYQEKAVGRSRKKIASLEIEEVVAWIDGCRAKNFRLNRAGVCRKAADLAR